MKTRCKSPRCYSLAIAVLVVLLSGSVKADLHDLIDPNTGTDSGWVASVDPDEDWPIGVVVDEVDVIGDAVIIQIKKTFSGSPDEYGLMSAMFVEFLKGVIVANAQRELLDLADSLVGGDVHLAKKPYAAGVEEGLEHFGVLSGSTSKL